MSARGFAVAALAVEVLAGSAACLSFWLSPFSFASIAWLFVSFAAALVVCV